MKTTIFGILLEVTPEQDTILRRLMRKYGFMLRFAFQRLVEGLHNVGGLERHLTSETELPLRYAKDAVQEAQDLLRARHQAMNEGLHLWTQRLKKTQARLTELRAVAHPNARRIAGQERKLVHQESRQAFYYQHVLALTGFVIGSAKVTAILALWSRSLDWHQMPWIKHSESAESIASVLLQHRPLRECSLRF